MTYFAKVDLPLFPTMHDDMVRLLDEKLISWHESHKQICINTIPGKEDDFLFGTGSRVFDWSNVSNSSDGNGNEIEVPVKSNTVEESDYTVLCSQFRGTVFEEAYGMLDDMYMLGRVRLMRSEPKTCLSWHVDASTRLHYPLSTQDGCLMVIEDEVMHLPLNQWTMADTTHKHTAFNASKKSRVHLVAVILGVR